MKIEAHVGGSEVFAWISFFYNDNSALKGEITLRRNGMHRLEIFREFDELAIVISRIYNVAFRRFTGVAKAKELLLEILAGYCDNDFDVEIDVKEI